MRLMGLPQILRDYGLDVIETDGWKTRGDEFADTPKVVVAHHTASNAHSGNMPTLPTLIHGRPDLPGPLSQVGLARDATVYVVASGKANHAGPGKWLDVTTSSLTVGIEAENNGLGEPWPRRQVDAYDRVCAAMLDLLDSDSTYLCGHLEWALPPGRKIDPVGLDMDLMRTRVAALLEDTMPLSDKDVERIAAATATAVLDAAYKDESTVRTSIRNTHRYTEKILDIVEALGAGESVKAKALAASVRAELSRALKE